MSQSDSEASDEILSETEAGLPGIVKPPFPSNLPRTTNLPTAKFDAQNVDIDDEAFDEHKNINGSPVADDANNGETTGSSTSDDTNMETSSPSLPVPKFNIDMKTLQALIKLTEQLNQQPVRWGFTSLPLPNNTLIATLDKVNDCIRHDLDAEGTENGTGVMIVLDQILRPIFQRVILDEYPMTQDDLKNVISCVFRYITIFVNKMAKCANSDPMPFIYWDLFRMCTERNSRFFSRVQAHSKAAILQIAPGDLSFDSWILSGAHSAHWYQATILWFHKLRGFDVFKEYFTSHVDHIMKLEDVFIHIEWIQGFESFMNPRCIREKLNFVLEFICECLDSFTEDEWTKESFNDICQDPSYKIFNFVRQYLHYAKGVNVDVEDYNRAKKAKQLKLLYLKKCVIMGNFNSKMMAMDYLCHSLMEDGDLDMNADDLQEFIAQIELVPTLLKDNLHHLAYIERLVRVISALHDRGVLDETILDMIWEAQQGKHDVIQRNMHQLTAKLIVIFNDELVHAFLERIVQSWTHGSLKEKETILDLLRRVGEHLFNIHDMAFFKTKLVASILEILWLWSRENLFDGLREKIFDAIIELLQEASHTTTGLQLTQETCRKVADCIVNSNETVGNGEDLIGLWLTLMRRILTLFPEGDYRYGEINRRAQMLRKLDEMYSDEDEGPGPFSFGRLVVQGICDFIDRVDFESAVPSVCSGSTIESEYSSETSSEDENGTLLELIASLTIRLDFVEFLLENVRRSRDIDVNPFENDWVKTLWNKLINPRHPQRLQNLGFHFFGSMIRYTHPQDHQDSFITFFQENVMSVEPATLTVKGFECFEAFLKHANMATGNLTLQLLPCDASADEREIQLRYPDFEGEYYLRQTVVLSCRKVYKMAYTLLNKLWQPSPKETHDHMEMFVSSVIRKCSAWLQDVDSRRSEVNKAMADDRVKRVLTAIIDLLDRNETERRLSCRRHPIFRRAILGKGIRINVSFKVEEMQMIFRDQRVPLHISRPVSIVVHENMLLGDLIKQICGIINNQGGAITPYALQLVRKGIATGGGSNRFGVSDWGQTLKELQIETLSQLTTRIDKSKVGEDGSSDAMFVNLTGEEECHAAEKMMLSYKLVHCAEFMERIFSLGDDAEIVEQCTQLFCGLPTTSHVDFDKYTTLEEKVERFKQFNSDLKSEPSGAKRLYMLFQLYEFLLPSSLPTKSNGEALIAFFAARGPSALISLFSSYQDVDCLDEFAALTCEVLLRILPNVMFLFITATLDHEEDTISYSICDFYHILKNYADPCIVEVSRSLTVPPKFKTDSFFLDVTERDLRSFLHIGFKFMRDNARSYVLTSLLDAPADPDLMDPMVDESDNLVSSCVNVFSILCSYNIENGFKVLESEQFHEFLYECCTEEESSVELTRMIPQLLADVGRERRSPILLEAAISYLFKHLDTNNSLFWDVLYSLVETFNGARKEPLPGIETHVEEMLAWLDMVQKRTEETMCHFTAQHVLTGRLKLAQVLFAELDMNQRSRLGVARDGPNLVERLLYNFLIPSSRAFAQQQSHETTLSRLVRSQTAVETITTTSESMDFLTAVPRSTSTVVLPSSTVSVCKTDEAQEHAYKLLQVLCDDPSCLARVVKIINEVFYENRTLDKVVWEYQPDYSLRQPGHFVGLKNGGATCYMNSILQQLYMIGDVRDAILNAPIEPIEDGDNRPYEIQIVGALQSVFAHLAGSELEAYTPEEFWNIIKINERPVNVHEQQDAFEFFNTVVDLIDEGMNKVGSAKIGSQVFGGLFADEKICKDCPHKYSRDEPFTSISIDVRSHNNIIDSLHEFVKGDVLENDNAYHCEKCDKKVRAVKRLSIKKLPTNLVVQLKRFEFDWEKGEPVKFNDYFEFPFSLDMKPYTAEALASLDESGQSPSSADGSLEDNMDCCYKLRGVLVHSGQATGGHYFSYIRNDDGKWFKFDDNDVQYYECEPRDVKYKWFGEEPGIVDFTGRRRSRIWWNAFLLFYEKVNPSFAMDSTVNTNATVIPPMLPVTVPLTVDPVLAQAVDSSRRSSTASPVTRLHKRFSTMSLMFAEKLPLSLGTRLRNIPPQLEIKVRNKNTRIMHERNEYNKVFYTFIFNLVKKRVENYDIRFDAEFRQLMILFSNFLIYTYLHSSVSLRKDKGYDTFNGENWSCLLEKLCGSKAARLWLISNVILNEGVTRTYLLNAKDIEIRQGYIRMTTRVLELSASKGDTVNDLLQYRSNHVTRFLTNRYKQEPQQLAVNFLVETLVGLLKSCSDKQEKVTDVILWISMLWGATTVPSNLMIAIARSGMLGLLLSYLDGIYGSYFSISNNAHWTYWMRMASILMRVIDLPRDATTTGEHGPLLCCSPEECLKIDAIPDRNIISTFINCFSREEMPLRHVDIIIQQSWNLDGNEWMPQLIQFVCWNRAEPTRRLLNYAVRLICTDRTTNQSEQGMQLLHLLVHLNDDIHDSDLWIKYLISDVNLMVSTPHGAALELRDFVEATADTLPYGLRAVSLVRTGYKKENLLRALIIVLEAFGDRIFTYISEEDKDRFLQIFAGCRMPVFNMDPAVTQNRIPNILDARYKMAAYGERFRRSVCETIEDDSIEEKMESSDTSEEPQIEMEQPLDLTLPGTSSGRIAITAPQSAEKRTLPTVEDDTDSLNGQGEAKKSRIVPAVVDDEDLLLGTSSSVAELEERNSQNPPPNYDEI